MMTQQQAQAFARQIVPDGVFDKDGAQEWCDFLNFIFECEAYTPCQIESKGHWANGRWFVSNC